MSNLQDGTHVGTKLLFSELEPRVLLSVALLPPSGDVHLASGPGTPILVGETGPDFRPILFKNSGSKWVTSDMQSLGIGPRYTDDTVAWVDQRTAGAYALASSPAGLVLFSEGPGGAWSTRNLAESLPAASSRLHSLVTLTANDSRVFIAGLDQSEDLILISQDSAALPEASGWSITNLSRGDLALNGLTAPKFSGPLSAFVTLWGTLHICGIGDDGDIHVVWRDVVTGPWQDANLSAGTSAPALVGVATPFLSSWGGIHIASADAQGHVYATWWVPGFGGEWRVNDLTADTAFPNLQPTSLSAFATRWDGLTIAGLDSTGRLLAYWWTPALSDAWRLAALDTPVPLVGRLSSLADPTTGDMNIVGMSPDAGRFLRLHWSIASAAWNAEDLPGNGLPNRSAVEYLAARQDDTRLKQYVYRDVGDAADEFAARGKIGDLLSAVPTMDEAWTVAPNSGNTAIRARFESHGTNWGGWYFLSGMLNGSQNGPTPYWGTLPRSDANAGIDLSGTTELTFSARGAHGGEVVEFFVAGVGRSASTGEPIEQDPDSAPKQSTGTIVLDSAWHQYRIPLAGADLSYTLGGFGWVTNAPLNHGADIEFYIDDISYDLPRVSDPGFIVSYDSIPSDSDFDRVQRNVAYTYDNAVTLLAFLAAGQTDRAGRIADAFVYAQNHDRFYSDGRIRNAYQGGNLVLPPGWRPNGISGTVRMPGWYDPVKASWFEDLTQVSTSTGNMAWAAVALLAYHRATGATTSPYLDAAVRIAQWIESNTRDNGPGGGYRAGTENFDSTTANFLPYKATEHNIDLIPLFQQIDQLRPGQGWDDAARHARAFVDRMWDSSEGKFWTGTQSDGDSINRAVIPVDIQAWSVLALRSDAAPFLRSLDYADSHLAVRSGFDFNQDRDAVWYEGTTQMSAAFQSAGQPDRGAALVTFLVGAQRFDGAMPASERPTLTTGFDLPDGKPWLYFRREHIGATAWLALAEDGVNAYWALS